MNANRRKGKIGFYKEEDGIRGKLMSVKDWKVRANSQIRIEYDNNLRKSVINDVHKISEDVMFDFSDLSKVTKSNHKQAPTKLPRQSLSRYSRVFSKSTINKTTPIKPDNKMNRKDEKKQLAELYYDKQYFNRMLLDENVRMIFLRSSHLSPRIYKSKPYLRLWLEAIITRFSHNSHNMRGVIRKELAFLRNRYNVQRQLHFWHTLNSLTLDQLYDKKRQIAFKIRIRNDTFSQCLEEVWMAFHRGNFEKVSRMSSTLIDNIDMWPDHNPNSLKYKLLADLNYVKGLALMQLEKLDLAYQCFRRDGEIGEYANIEVSKARTKDNIGRIQAIKGNYKTAIKLWSERSEVIGNPVEKAWIFYNMALCYALDDQNEKAIEYVYKSINNAETAGSYCWEMNGYLLLANCTAYLGTVRETNVRNNTLIALKAINKAYQSAVFLANVTVIHKIMEIALSIYNSFKDIDLSMLDEVWCHNLLDYSRKASNLGIEKTTTNLNNPGNTKRAKFEQLKKVLSTNLKHFIPFQKLNHEDQFSIIMRETENSNLTLTTPSVKTLNSQLQKSSKHKSQTDNKTLSKSKSKSIVTKEKLPQYNRLNDIYLLEQIRQSYLSSEMPTMKHSLSKDMFIVNQSKPAPTVLFTKQSKSSYHPTVEIVDSNEDLTKSFTKNKSNKTKSPNMTSMRSTPITAVEVITDPSPTPVVHSPTITNQHNAHHKRSNHHNNKVTWSMTNSSASSSSSDLVTNEDDTLFHCVDEDIDGQPEPNGDSEDDWITESEYEEDA